MALHVIIKDDICPSFQRKMEEPDVEGYVKELDDDVFHKDMDDEIKKKKERQVTVKL